MQNSLQWFASFLTSPLTSYEKLVISLIVIFFLWVVYKIVAKILFAYNTEIHSRYRWQKLTIYFIGIIGTLFLGKLWFEGSRHLSTFLGLFSAGVAIALKDMITNIAGWLFIIARQPFNVGDRVEIGNHSGDVIDLRLFQFTILEIGNWIEGDQSTGRIIHIPNGMIFTVPLANYNKGFNYIWNEIPVLITFESNWKKAKQILNDLAHKHASHQSEAAKQKVREASKKFMIFYSHLTPIIYTKVKDNGVMLTVRYLCEPRRRRGSEQAIWEDVLDAFAGCNDIDFAYPTTRLYDNHIEGKVPEKKPPLCE